MALDRGRSSLLAPGCRPVDKEPEPATDRRPIAQPRPGQETMPNDRSSRPQRRVALALLGGALLLATSAPGLAQSQPLRIAVEGEYPPFNAVADGGKLSGFDV